MDTKKELKTLISKSIKRILTEKADVEAKEKNRKLAEAVEFIKKFDLTNIKDKKELKKLTENIKKTLDFIEKTF